MHAACVADVGGESKSIAGRAMLGECLEMEGVGSSCRSSPLEPLHHVHGRCPRPKTLAMQKLRAGGKRLFSAAVILTVAAFATGIRVHVHRSLSRSTFPLASSVVSDLGESVAPERTGVIASFARGTRGLSERVVDPAWTFTSRVIRICCGVHVYVR